MAISPPQGGVGAGTGTTGVDIGETLTAILAGPGAGANATGGSDIVMSSGDKLTVTAAQVFVCRTGGDPDRGLAMDDNGTYQTDATGARTVRLNQAGLLDLGSGGAVRFSAAADPDGSKDLDLVRDAAGVLRVADGGAGFSDVRASDVEAHGDGSTVDGTVLLKSFNGAAVGVVLDTGPSFAFLRARQEGTLAYVGYEGSEIRCRTTAGGSVAAALQASGGLTLSSGNNIFFESTPGTFEIQLKRGGAGVLTVQRFTGTDPVRITGGDDNTPTQFDGFISGRVQNGRVEPSSSGSDLSGTGLLATITETDFSSSLQVTSSGNALRQQTNTPVGNVAGWDVGVDIVHFSAKAWACFVFGLSETANQRSFVGFSDQTFNVMVGADDPAGNYVGMQVRDGDTNFFLVHKDGTTLTRIDTGIAVAASRFFLIVDVLSPTNVNLTLKNADGSSLFTTNITSGLPGASTLHEPMIGTYNTVGGTGRSIDTYSAALVLRA